MTNVAEFCVPVVNTWFDVFFTLQGFFCRFNRLIVHRSAVDFKQFTLLLNGQPIILHNQTFPSSQVRALLQIFFEPVHLNCQVTDFLHKLFFPLFCVLSCSFCFLFWLWTIEGTGCILKKFLFPIFQLIDIDAFTTCYLADRLLSLQYFYYDFCLVLRCVCVPLRHYRVLLFLSFIIPLSRCFGNFVFSF